jgi:pimeloyl-ACP methyl ester carboxylesterase
MSTYALVPGAGGAAWYWSRVAPLLRDAGHHVIAVDLPADDEQAGLPEYAELVVAAIGDRDDVVLVAQSLGGFTAAMVASRVPLLALVFVNAMIPRPGETPGEWSGATRSAEAREAAAKVGGYGDFDEVTYFLHDVPADVAAEAAAHQRPEVDAVFASPCDFTAWPAVPTRVVIGADDRLFPAAFQRAVAPDRLDVTDDQIDVLSGGHLLALAHPEALTDLLLRM